MTEQTYYRRASSRLSTSRLRIEGESDTNYQVRAYNFRDLCWMKSTRSMKKTAFHANYEVEA